MDTSFLNYLLGLSLSLILIVYLNQTMTIKQHKQLKQLKNKMPMQMPMQMQKTIPMNLQTQKMLTQCKTGMPVHSVGPVINFHQRFTKYTTNPTYTTIKGCGIPTGIPELGWRNMYLYNFSKSEVPEDNQFSGIITKNYLNNMENVDNIYRKCD